MERSKGGIIMSQYDVLQRIPLLYEYDENDPEYGGFDYICTKDMVMTLSLIHI